MTWNVVRFLAEDYSTELRREIARERDAFGEISLAAFPGRHKSLYVSVPGQPGYGDKRAA